MMLTTGGRSVHIAALGLWLILAGPVDAQDVKLTQVSARLGHQFSVISGLRELPDGRLLVSDGIDNVLVRVDLATQRMDTIGRAGQGPGEYRSPDALFSLPGGGTLLVDLGNGRLSVFDGAGKYQESMPISRGTPGSSSGFSLIVPRATDNQGRVYFQPLGGNPGADSGMIVRWDRGTGAFDSVARVKLPAVITKTSGSPDNQRTSQRQPVYPVQEAWSVAADGRVALVRAPAYRVDWVPSAGPRTVGAPISSVAVPIGNAEKKEFFAEQAANGLSVSISNENGNVSMQFSRGRRAGADDDDDQPKLDSEEWPAAKPAVSGLVITDLAGRLWVERSVPAGAARIYDVIGPDAKVARRVTLPVGRRLIAVGARGLYVRHIDSDGISYLERFDLR